MIPKKKTHPNSLSQTKKIELNVNKLTTTPSEYFKVMIEL